MRRLNLFLLFLLFNLSAYSEFSEDKKVSFRALPRGEVWKGDFFAAATGVEISGQATQDVYIAGSQVIIDGEVMGDVLMIGGTLEISGVVHGNVRAIAGEVLITGTIDKSISTCSGNIHVGTTARIHGGAVIVSGNADIAGTLDNDLTVAASNVRLACTVSGNATAFAGQIRVTSRANIAGFLSYSSSEPLWIEPEAAVSGGVKQNTSAIQEIIKHKWLDTILLGSRIAGFMMNFIYTFAIGFILLKFYPNNIEATARYLRTKPLRALLNGVLVALIVPLVSFLLLMTILGVPFALTLIAANIIGFYTAKVYVIYWASELLFEKFNLSKKRVLAFTTGNVIYFLLINIPYAGVFFSILSMLAGLGAIVSTQVHKRLSEKHHPMD